MTRFAYRILLLASVLAVSAHVPQSLQAMGDISFPTLTFPVSDSVTRDPVILAPVLIEESE